MLFSIVLTINTRYSKYPNQCSPMVLKALHLNNDLCVASATTNATLSSIGFHIKKRSIHMFNIISRARNVAVICLWINILRVVAHDEIDGHTHYLLVCEVSRSQNCSGHEHSWEPRSGCLNGLSWRLALSRWICFSVRKEWKVWP